MFRGLDVLLIEKPDAGVDENDCMCIKMFLLGQVGYDCTTVGQETFQDKQRQLQKNKNDSKEFVHTILNDKQGKKLLQHKKKDDVADAVIQLQFYLNKL